MGQPPLLSKTIEGENLYLYLVVSKETVSATLVRKEEIIQWHVYYVSKRLLDAEIRYPELEKLALALRISSRKLRPYFYSHTIEVLMNYPYVKFSRHYKLLGGCLSGQLSWGNSTLTIDLKQ